jgi:hypothetical protein
VRINTLESNEATHEANMLDGSKIVSAQVVDFYTTASAPSDLAFSPAAFKALADADTEAEPGPGKQLKGVQWSLLKPRI